MNPVNSMNREHNILGIRSLLSLTLVGFLLAGCGGDPKLQVKFSRQPSAIVAGEAMASPVELTLQDEEGKPYKNEDALEVTLAASEGTLQGTAKASFVDGVARFPGLSLTKAGSAFTLQATTGEGHKATSSPFAVRPAAAVTFEVVSAPSEGAADEPLAPVEVRLLDAYGNVSESNATVTVALGEGTEGVTLSGTTSVQAVNGVAKFEDLEVDRTGEGFTLTFSATGVTAAASPAINVKHGKAEAVVFTAQPSSVVAGVAIAPAVQVTLRDKKGNVATTTAGDVTVALVDDAGAALSGTLTRPVVSGVATFDDLSISKAKAGYALRATFGTLTATSSTFAVTHAAPANVVFTAQPADAVAGATLNEVQVTVRDSFGNVATGSTADIALGLSSATLHGTATVAAVAGVAKFADLSVQKAGTGYTLAASSAGLVGDTSSEFDVGHAAAAKLVVLEAPASGTAGATLAPALKVGVVDAFDNAVPTFAGTLSVALGTAPSGAVLSGTSTVTTADGTVEFTDFKVQKSGSYTLTVSSGSLAPATTASFSVGAAAPASLAFTQQPSNVVAGAVIAPAVTVTLKDAYGNVASTPDEVGITLGTAPAGALLLGDTFVTPAAGVASFGDLALQKAGSYTLAASFSVFAPVSSSSFTVAPAAPASIAWLQQPTATRAGFAVSPATRFSILDAYGNAATNYNGPASIVLGNVATTGGALVGTTSATAAAGVATFSGYGVNLPGTGYTLRGRVGTTVMSPESAAFDILAVGTKLVYTDPSVGKIRLVRDAVNSTNTTLYLDMVTTEDLTGYGVGFNLPADSTRIQMPATWPIYFGTDSGYAINPGEHPAAAKAVVATTGPMANMLVAAVSQKSGGAGAVTTDTFIPAGSYLATLAIQLRTNNGSSTGSVTALPGVVFDGTTLPAGFNGAMRDRFGTDVVGRNDFGIGRLVVE